MKRLTRKVEIVNKQLENGKKKNEEKRQKKPMKKANENVIATFSRI